jgi:hypothetical protein
MPGSALGSRRPNSAAALLGRRANPNNPFPLQYQFDAAWDSLDQWVRSGVPAPHAPHIAAVGDGTPTATILTDEYGNALGGVRSPAVDVPTATYYGTTAGPGTCLLLWGHWTPFSDAQLSQLYPSSSDYVQKVQSDVAALRADRWLTKEDAAAIVSQAQSAQIP